MMMVILSEECITLNEDHIEVQEGPNRRARSIMVNMDNHLNHPDDDAVRVWERNRNLKNPKATKENINEILRAIAFNKALSLKRSMHKSPLPNGHSRAPITILPNDHMREVPTSALPHSSASGGPSWCLPYIGGA